MDNEIYLNEKTWNIEDKRLTRYKRVDTLSAFCALFEYGCNYAIDTIHHISHQLNVNSDERYPFELPTQQPLYSRHFNFESIYPKGLVIFFHGLRSSSWQWRHVISSFVESTEFCEYKFWVPELEYGGNCDAWFAAEKLKSVITEFAHQSPHAFLYFIGTSNGARIAATLETQLNVETFKNIHLRFVSIAGFFGPSDLAKSLDYIGLLKPFCYSPCIREALVEESPHLELLELWDERQKIWKKYNVDVKHKFYASIDDERLYPATISFPKLKYSNPEDYVLVKGWDHCGIVVGLKYMYLSWCKSTAVTEISKKEEFACSSSMYYVLAECHMALDEFGEFLLLSLDSSPSDVILNKKEACEVYKKYIVDNEEYIKWSSEFVLVNFSNNIYLGDLLNQAFSSPIMGTEEPAVLRKALLNDITIWMSELNEKKFEHIILNK